jgi:hypothetical protein
MQLEQVAPSRAFPPSSHAMVGLFMLNPIFEARAGTRQLPPPCPPCFLATSPPARLTPGLLDGRHLQACSWQACCACWASARCTMQ